MAYSDVQDKLGQIKMTNMNLIAQAMSDEEKFKKKKELKKQVRKTPKQRQSEARGKDPKFQGGSPGTVFVPPDGPTTDQDIQDALQDEDMRQGDYLQDPENPLNNLMMIGGAAAGFGGNLLKMLINPLGGRQLAEAPNFPGGGFTTTSGAFVDLSGEAYYLDDGELIPEGGYDPAIHGDLIPGGGPVTDRVMNETNDNNSMMIYGT